MKLLHCTRSVTVPEGITIEVKGRQVRVKGPRGQLTRDFKHTKLDFSIIEEEGQKKVKVDCHFGKRKSLAVMRTTTSHISNLFTGVTKGYEYKLRLVYAHFPINVNILEEGKLVEVRNFLGEKRVRSVQMYPGVTCARSSTKDELLISGNDVDDVSHSAALISGQCHVRKKDIRKFLDGVYLSERGNIVKEEWYP